MSNEAHVLNRFPDTTFIFLTITSAAKELASVYEIQVTNEIDMSQEREGPHSDDNESFMESKKSWEFGYVNIEMNVSWGKLGVSIWNLNATSKFECQYEDLGT